MEFGQVMGQQIWLQVQELSIAGGGCRMRIKA